MFQVSQKSMIAAQKAPINVKYYCMKSVHECACCNSHYPNYAISPRDGVCHAHHACAVKTVLRLSRQVFVYFRLKVITCIKKIIEFQYKSPILKDTIMIYDDIWLHF